MNPKKLSIQDFTYDLPQEKIAVYPLDKRDESKLAIIDHGKISSSQYKNIPHLLDGKYHFVFNNTRVVHARLLFPRGEGQKPFEVFCLEPLRGMDVQQAMAKKKSIVYNCLIGRAKQWKGAPKSILVNASGQDLILTADKGEVNDGVYEVTFSWNLDLTFAEVLGYLGKTPLPPYLNREVEEKDNHRYQTVYATYEGSVAAPTAGLHFSEELLNQLTDFGHTIDYATLHVGAGTFKPVTADTLDDHPMHYEEIHISKSLIIGVINHLNSIVAVGTTSARTLESLYWLGCILQDSDEKIPEITQWTPYDLENPLSVKESLQNIVNWMDSKGVEQFSTRTQLIIAPGYKYRVVDLLFTNFHQPQSTLILLVAAAIGDDWKKLYQYALENNFRFLSYGDGCMIRIKNK